jgi:ABC-2 type transport system ATP-binding protein
MSLILEANHLCKQYDQKGKRFVAVRDVSLQMAAGQVLAFLGPNGAGKTTTIKMIAGLILPDRGTVYINQRNPHRDPSALQCLGAVLEGNRNLYWRLTPEENLEYFGVLRGLTAGLARQRSKHLLDRFELSHKRKTVVQQLSRGMQQKLAIAMALIHEPQLLLLDEPTLGLDVEATQTVKRLVREIAAEGRAILLTTHQLDIAEELSDRVAIINRGEIVTEKATIDLIQEFSRGTYQIELEQALDPDRLAKLESLGVTLETPTCLHLSDPEFLYAILEVLRPLSIVQVTRDRANLTDVFLQLVGQENRD